MARLAANPYPYLTFTGAASDPAQQQINPQLLTRLNAVAGATGNVIDIFSGRRPTGSKFGYGNDPHQRGEAVDAYVNGKDIGYVIPVATLAKYGLEGGNVPGFWSNPKNSNPTGADPEHVQIPDSGVNKSLSYTPGTTPATLTAAAVPAFDPSHPDERAASAVTGALYGTSLVNQIVAAAQKYGIDPRIPLAVAPHEGGFEGADGDFSGNTPTSFGPFALHEGGALPQWVWDKGVAFAKQWANSPAGIDYAVQGGAKTLAGATGTAGVAKWVSGYERPAAQYVGRETAASLATFASEPTTYKTATPPTTTPTTTAKAPATTKAAPTKTPAKTTTAGTTLASQLADPKPVPLTVPSSGVSASSLAALLKVAAAQGDQSAPLDIPPVTAAAPPTRLDLTAPGPVAPLMLNTPAPPVSQPLTLTTPTPPPSAATATVPSVAAPSLPVAPTLKLPNLAPSAAGIIAPSFAQWLKAAAGR